VPRNGARQGFLPTPRDAAGEASARELADLTTRVEQLERELAQLRRGVRHLLEAEVRGDHERRVLEARLAETCSPPRPGVADG
jgi:transposase